VTSQEPDARLLGAADIREIAGRLNLRPTRRLGQNFVTDPGTIRRIVALAGIRPAETVLEVGPGLGSLTLGLLPAARRVLAVEVDPVLAAELSRTVADRAGPLAARLEVRCADALRLTGLPPDPPDPPDLLVANLPYNIAVPVLLHLLDVLPTLQRGLVMVQAEVADRMSAAPGSRVYGAPSAKLAWHASVRRAGTVPRTVFWPVPNVDSALVEFSRWPAGPPGLESSAAGRAGPVSRAEVYAVIDAAFSQRRKTLRAALAGWAGSAAMAEQILRAAGVDPGARGEDLGITSYLRIAATAHAARTIIKS
jgi:16S rRNA (adenine1518-N6/adenine1519-N6)-dimethyltransferase